jgi:hypothetical protein
MDGRGLTMDILIQRHPIAVRLAGGSDFEFVTAGQPDC